MSKTKRFLDDINQELQSEFGELVTPEQCIIYDEDFYNEYVGAIVPEDVYFGDEENP